MNVQGHSSASNSGYLAEVRYLSEWRCRDKGVGADGLLHLSRAKGLTAAGGVHGNVGLGRSGGSCSG